MYEKYYIPYENTKIVYNTSFKNNFSISIDHDRQNPKKVHICSFY
jgi:hypothetical protein